MQLGWLGCAIEALTLVSRAEFLGAVEGKEEDLGKEREQWQWRRKPGQETHFTHEERETSHSPRQGRKSLGCLPAQGCGLASAPTAVLGALV